MEKFARELDRRRTGTEDRRRLYVPYDPLTDRAGAQRREDEHVYRAVRRRLADGDPVRVEDVT